ncbi:MAG: ribosome silencing factor [Clostridiales bacterium]|nr:ribosome silencing factor [Clostridiales bacterium]
MKELIEKIATILYNKKANNIVALDVTELTVITECMIIASGRSTMQVKALGEEVEDRLTEMGIEPARKEGYQDGKWIILDYGAILVHIFHQEDRDFYRLDKLWETEDNRIAMPFENQED